MDGGAALAEVGEPQQPSASRPERRSFTLHHSLIRTLILDQAAGLDAALRELVMNAIDAGATAVHITLDHERFEVRDDGRGMGTRADVLRNFECFGRPQDAIPKAFGRYRLGRAQILGYAATTWRSGTLQMTVDFHHSTTSGTVNSTRSSRADPFVSLPELPHDAAFEYDLIDDAPHTSGTVVTGRFHRPLPQAELDGLIRHALGVRYVAIPVHLNGRQASTPPADCTWTFEDDTAWYLIDDAARATHEGLLIYNQGVFVERAEATLAGCVGIVVTKKPLKLTLGRNDVATDCWVWREVLDALACHLHSALAHRDPKQPPAREEVIRVLRLLTGMDPIARDLLRSLWRYAYTAPLLQGLNHKRYSMADLAGQVISFFNETHALVGETADQRGMCIVLRTGELLDACRELGTRSHEHAERICANLLDTLFEGLSFPAKVPRAIPFQRVIDALHDLGGEIAESALSEEGRVGLEVLRRAAKGWAGAWKGHERARYRAIHPGRSDTLLAWTDGLSTIHVSEGILEGVCHGFGGLHKALLVMAHELAHDAPSRGQTAHDAAFYARFHDIVHGCRFLKVSTQAQADLVRLLGQRKLQVRSAMGAHVDAITTLGATLKRKRRGGKTETPDAPSVA